MTFGGITTKHRPSADCARGGAIAGQLLLRPLHLRQFGQVVSQGGIQGLIDSLRERRVMSLKTRLGNLGNILDEDESQCRLLQLDSPVLSNAEFLAMRDYMAETAAEIDCTFDAGAAEQALRSGLTRIQREAEDAVRGGKTHIILTDERTSADRVAIPMILATAAVHRHLMRERLRTFTSLNIRSGECLDVHYFAVLIGAATGFALQPIDQL